MENYLKLLEIAKNNVAACELARRYRQAVELFAEAVKEYGDSERAAAHTSHESDGQTYYYMLEGYYLGWHMSRGMMTHGR